MAGLLCDCRRRSSASSDYTFLDVLFPLLLRTATLHNCIIGKASLRSDSRIPLADGEAAHHLGVQDPVPGRAVPAVFAQGHLHGLRPDHPGRRGRAVAHGPRGDPVFQMLDQCSPMQDERPGLQKASTSCYAFRQHPCMHDPGGREHMAGSWHARSTAGMHTFLQQQHCTRQRVQTR